MCRKIGPIYKTLCVLLLIYAVVAGLTINLPYQLPIIYESIRNVFYHVGMWFTMMVTMSVSVFYSLRYLKGFSLRYDRIAVEAATVGIVFGMLGIFTGMMWANATWGAPWVRDPKLNGAAMGLLVYFAYMILRSSVGDEEKRARISAVYNIFAFVLMILFIHILPQLAGESLHPDQPGQPMVVADLDPVLRTVFYPAILGWILLAVWILEIRVRLREISDKIGR